SSDEAHLGYSEKGISMRTFLSLLVVAFATLTSSHVRAEPKTITFEDAEPNRLPAGFSAALTGSGKPVQWGVVPDTSANGGHALAEPRPDPTDYRFPLAIYDFAAKDVEVTIHFRPVAGRVDQAAGIAVRLTDANNYYVVRANALENNVRLYRVVKGN